MAFALIGIGLLLFMAAYHNNVATLGSQISADVTGSSGFFIWVVALLIVGLIGYIPVLRGVSRLFLVLVLVVIFLANKGFFSSLTSALGITSQSDGNSNTVQTPNTPNAPNTPQAAPQSSGNGNGGGGGGGF